MRQWAIALACAGCLLATTSAQAQWGLNGQSVDPRNDPCICGNAVAEACTNTPGVDVSLAYLLWWFRDPHVAAPPAGISPSQFEYESFSGVRGDARFWCDNTQTGSFEVGGFYIWKRTTGATTGGTTALTSAHMWSAEGNLVVNTLSFIDLIAGFRYLDLNEDADFNTAGVESGANTHNQFYGGQIGARAAGCCCGIYWSVLGKIGLGDNHETLLLSSPTLTGLFTRDAFTVVPEIQTKVGYQVLPGATLYVGFDYLLLDRALRAGENTAAVPAGTTTPDFHTKPFWAYGIETGIEVRY
jgi:hypothetical protein